MAKPHWYLTIGEDNNRHALGCQHSQCDKKATWQWQREATEEEIQAEANLEGPYGEVARNPQGPHNVAVFACDEHTPKHPDGSHHLDRMAVRHASHCPAPDGGCECE